MTSSKDIVYQLDKDLEDLQDLRQSIFDIKAEDNNH